MGRMRLGKVEACAPRGWDSEPVPEIVLFQSNALLATLMASQ